MANSSGVALIEAAILRAADLRKLRLPRGRRAYSGRPKKGDVGVTDDRKKKCVMQADMTVRDAALKEWNQRSANDGCHHDA